MNLKRTSMILSALLAMSLMLAACGPLGGDDDDDGAPPQPEETAEEGETPEADDEDAQEDETATPEGEASPSPEATEEDETAEETPDGETAQVDGEAIFLRECAACHGEDGEGYERDGSYILPHNGNPLVTAEDPIGVVSVVLTGRGGMPRFDGVLSDEEIAAVISYIRGAWDNDAGEVDPATIDEIRQDVMPEDAEGEEETDQEGEDEGEEGDETQGSGDQEEDEDAEATVTEESEDEN